MLEDPIVGHINVSRFVDVKSFSIVIGVQAQAAQLIEGLLLGCDGHLVELAAEAWGEIVVTACLEGPHVGTLPVLRESARALGRRIG